MTVTVKDVAQWCGVDPAVVCRVLNARLPDIDEDTKKAVLEAAEHLGYPGGGHTPNLGVLYADESGRGLTHPFFVLILNAFKAEAEARGYDMTFIHPGSGENVSYEKRCLDAGVDGVCLVCMDFRAPQIKALAQSGIPCVSVDHIFKGAPAVLSDNETGVEKLVEYAVSRGHRRIAFIHGHNNSIVTRTRINQFYNTMTYRGLTVPPEYVREGLYDDIELTRKIVIELLKLPERPTCILLPDDISYLGAQDAARDLGLRVPQDISFAGYDGIPLTQMLAPRLTTIRQSSDDIGRMAARKLIDLIERPESASRKPSVFPVQLIEGGTIEAI